METKLIDDNINTQKLRKQPAEHIGTFVMQCFMILVNLFTFFVLDIPGLPIYGIIISSVFYTFSIANYLYGWYMVITVKNYLEIPNDLPQSTFCNKCNCYRPEKCHHCSTCDRCILDFDHHCPWVLNCVGKYNHCYFIKYTFWVSIITLINSFTCLAAGLMHNFGSVFNLWNKDYQMLYWMVFGLVMMGNMIGMSGFGMTLSHMQLAFTGIKTFDIMTGRINKVGCKGSKANLNKVFNGQFWKCMLWFHKVKF
uniref:Palmitoyltransferase n=1 Tax=Trepomonas sp. PC1 TaxID=1076344 RepID=A0A146KEQ6_9EUKA|eukprot:JAP94364.1 Palmitoyltransferase [Trepomonas sp. PC1]